MPTSKALFCTMLVVSFAIQPMTANGQAIPISDDADYVVRVDLEAMRASRLGRKLIDVAKAIAAEEIDGGKRPDEAIEEVEKALGFDPFEELRSVTVVGQISEDPLEGVRVVVGLGESTGNLEGLLLAVPGYDSSEHGDYVVHSVAPDDDVRVYGAIHGDRAKQIVITTGREDLESVLDGLGKRRRRSLSDRDDDRSDDSASIASVRVHRIPMIEDLDGPPRVVAKLVREFAISVAEEDDHLAIEMKLKAESGRQAEQLQQLVQGLAAMVGLIQDSEEADEDLELVAELVEDLEVERESSSVEIRLAVPEGLVIDFLRDEADLPLSR